MLANERVVLSEPECGRFSLQELGVHPFLKPLFQLRGSGWPRQVLLEAGGNLAPYRLAETESLGFRPQPRIHHKDGRAEQHEVKQGLLQCSAESHGDSVTLPASSATS